MELNKAIRIINQDMNENILEQDQLEAFRVFFKELFDTDIQNNNGGYKSMHEVFSKASKKFHSE